MTEKFVVPKNCTFAQFKADYEEFVPPDDGIAYDFIINDKKLESELITDD